MKASQFEKIETVDPNDQTFDHNDEITDSLCSIYKTCRTIVETSEDRYCSFCYEYCKDAKPAYTKVYFEDDSICNCKHTENPEFFKTAHAHFLENFAKVTVRKFTAFNQFFMHQKKGRSIFEIIDPLVTGFLAKDLDSLSHGAFRWEDVDVDNIKKRALFAEMIGKKPLKLARLPLLSVAPIEQIFPLRFIDLITDGPDYTFGEPIYNNSLEFYTHLLDLFVRFYLLKDFQYLDKIDAQDIDTYSPLSRHFIREKNRSNEFIQKKYFNNEFNVHKFAVKLVDKFVPGATWRWIGGNHKAHIVSVKVCKILCEYGLLNENEMEELKHILYMKVQIYKALEVVIDKDAPTVDAATVTGWTDGLKLVREFYAEILIQYLYMKLDKEIVNYLVKINKVCGKVPNKKEIENIVNFNKSFLFEDEFGRRMMDFLFSYILSQNTIADKKLSTRKIELVTDNFLHIFCNSDDPFLHSLKLIREDDYYDFVNENWEEQINKSILIEFNNIFKEIVRLKDKIQSGIYNYRESNCFAELIKILKNIKNKLENQTNGKFKTMQRILSISNIPLVITIILTNYFEHSDYFKPENYDNTELFSLFSFLIKYYMNNNLENHSSYLVETNFWNVENMFHKFPVLMVDILLEVFTVNPQIMITKEYILDVLLDMFAKDVDAFTNPATESIEGYMIITKILKLFELHMTLNCFKVFYWIPEYDIRLSMDMVKYPYFLNMEEFKKLLQEYTGAKNTLNTAKIEAFLEFFICLTISTTYRYTQATWKTLNEKLKLEGMIELIDLASGNIKIRKILIDLYTNVHIDFKNQMINNRSDYYLTKPADLQYEEDPFYDKDYDKTIDMILKQLNLIIDIYNKNNKDLVLDKEELISFCNDNILASILKLINVFLIIREIDLFKLKKYVPKLEELQKFLLDNLNKFREIYGNLPQEFNSLQKKKYDEELAKTDEQYVIKVNKLKLMGSCNSIIEIISYLMTNRPLPVTKKSLLPKKSNVERTFKILQKTKSFSNKIQARKDNLNLPFENLERKYKKNKIQNILATDYLAALYENYKMKKMSIEDNVYIKSLDDINNKEIQTLTYNICYFIYNQFMSDWHIDAKNKKYTLIEGLVNILFIATKSVQQGLYKVIKEKGVVVLNKVWCEMKWYMSFVKYKTNLDKFWKETFIRTILLMNFHQFLCEDNNADFKKIMATETLQADSVDRTQRWTTIYQKMTESFQWHTLYNKDEIGMFKHSHREYLIPIAEQCFNNLAELCTGPSLINQKKIYRYIYDKYNGVMKRYIKDPNSRFHHLKFAIIEFMLSMIEGYDDDVLNFHTTNFELSSINLIIVNTIKQLYYCVVRKDPFDKVKINDYKLTMSDYKILKRFYQQNSDFSNHILMKVALKLFSYLKQISLVKSRYDIYFKENQQMLNLFKRKKEITIKSITEEDLVVYRFLNRILIKIEILRDDVENVVPYYFASISKGYYLSDASKESFLKLVDRSSSETKLAGLLAETEYFKLEMEHNENRYKNKSPIYSIFGSANYYYFELICFAICVINNVLLLIDLDVDNTSREVKFKNNYYITVIVLGIIEIVISFLNLFFWFYLSFPLIRKTNRLRYSKRHAYKEKLNIFDLGYIYIYMSLMNYKIVFVLFYHIIMVCLGLTISYGFIGIDLLSAISLFITMREILRSVTEHIGQLFSTLMLGAIIMFAYSIYIVIYFSQDLESANSCDNISHCYWTILNSAFTNGNGVGPLLTEPYYGHGIGDGRYYGQVILDVSFFLLINTVILNIILAILVDTFSDLRRKSDLFNIDSKKLCFICNIEKFAFEKAGIDFHKHLQEEHNIWNYVKFLVFMKEKEAKDCNGVEDELYHKINDGKLTWFPLGRSRSLEVKQKFEAKELTVNDLMKKIDTISGELAMK